MPRPTSSRTHLRAAGSSVALVVALVAPAVQAQAAPAAPPQPPTSPVVGGLHAGPLAGVTGGMPMAGLAMSAYATVQALEARVAAQQAAEKRTAERRAAERRDRSQTRASRGVARGVASGSPRAVARGMVADRGWSAEQYGCLDKLWTKESDWLVTADNPTSSAYGIPQALPGSKMASAGPDWATNPATQIRWGLGYIADRYGTPCAAWAHSQANNWY